MTWIEALILGLLQGLTEFLPVSSSGHLELGGVLFGLQDPDEFFTFNIVVHGATFLSVLVVFRRDIRDIIVNLFAFTWNAETRFAMLLIISAIPVAIVGLLFEEKIETLFEGRIVFVGTMLLVTAVLLFSTRFAQAGGKDLDIKRALLIGIAQTIAVLPGISRSGATISTALLLGVEKAKAVRFSFLMVLIPIFGANFLKILSMSSGSDSVAAEPAPLIIGALAAFLAGLAACKWMIGIVSKGKIEYFSIYCLIVGLTAIAAGLL